MWPIHQITQFLRYYLQAKTPRYMHSPYMYDLLTKVFDDEKGYYIFEKIERERSVLLKSDQVVKDIDFGAGSRSAPLSKRTVSDIARSALSSPRKCEVLFRLTEHLQPKVTIELGSSLGISSAYLGAAHTNGNVFSFEGNPDIVAIASQICSDLNVNNIEFISGDFENTLQAKLKPLDAIDLAFIDGNHRKEPTLRYFEMLCQKRSQDAVFVIDDIRWSHEMFDTWTEILADPRVKASIDIYSFGIVFFSPNFKEKLNLTVTPSRFTGGPILR